MNKELIKKRFAKCLSSYNSNATIQRQMAEKLVSYISPNFYEKVLELGCGTGLLTNVATDKLSFNNYVAVDIVPECENFIKKINSNIEFINCDIEKYNFQKYDLIISNATFQWVDNLPAFVDRILKFMNVNGILLFTTFGEKNYRELYSVVGKKLLYLSKVQLQKALNKYNPIIDEDIHIMTFDNTKEILNHIRNTGVNSIEQIAWTKKDLVNFDKKYKKICNNNLKLTYNPIYVKIQNSPAGEFII